ncbi:MAG: 1-acyl-sn-glycerol-3-phosphate acyltransferase [Bacteroidetes bacterium]|nr:MAG: 1-acyl-sn-glycerol-3-phosphate acyltransferase [Bacteroidota bacterium]
MFTSLRAYYRLVAFLFLSFGYLGWVLWRRARHPQAPDAWVLPLSRWARHMQRLLGLQVATTGDLPPRGSLLLPNHRSYLDVILFPPSLPVSFVAKSEVGRWPLIGPGTRAVQTVMVQRAVKDSRRATRAAVMARLAEGNSMVVFTEGTTVAAPAIGDLRPGMFQEAVARGLPVYPVALEYENRDIAWVGQDTFLSHFLRTYGRRRQAARIHFGPPLRGSDPEALRQATQQWLERETARLRAGWGQS